MYDAKKDKWQWKVLVSTQSNTRYKAGGISFVDGQIYWISDANGPEPHDRGIFRCNPADIALAEKDTLLFNPGVESGCMIIQEGVILASRWQVIDPAVKGDFESLAKVNDGDLFVANRTDADDVWLVGFQSPTCSIPMKDTGLSGQRTAPTSTRGPRFISHSI